MKKDNVLFQNIEVFHYIRNLNKMLKHKDLLLKTIYRVLMQNQYFKIQYLVDFNYTKKEML